MTFFRWIYDMGPWIHWSVYGLWLLGGYLGDARLLWLALLWWVLVAIARGLNRTTNESTPHG